MSLHARLSLIAAAIASALAAAPAVAAIPPEVTLVPFITGVTRPVAMRDGGNGRYYVVQQDGIIRVFENGALLPTPLLTLNATSTTCQMAPAASTVALGFTTPGSLGDERGLLGFELHPDFANNGLVFVHFSDARGDTAIVRYTVNGGTVADPNSCRIVIRVDQDSSNHNGGDLHFGPDGFLYIGLGDGGGSNDLCNRAQTLNPANLVNAGGTCTPDANFASTGDGNPDARALLGKFLRIDVDNTTPAGANELCAAYTDGSAGYAIPMPIGDVNPYAGNAGGAGICDETWSYGWRNPWRWSFDRTTGDLVVGDVGQGSWEEVDVEAAASPGAGNYGWRGCEGTTPVNGGSCAGTVAPVLTYSHASGRCSIAGGYRYRGDFAPLDGRYFYGDSCTGEIFVGTEGTPWTTELWLDAASQPGSYSLVSFAEDNTGRVFAIDHGQAAAGAGRVLLVSTPPAVLFGDGFEDLGP